MPKIYRFRTKEARSLRMITDARAQSQSSHEVYTEETVEEKLVVHIAANIEFFIYCSTLRIDRSLLLLEPIHKLRPILLYPIL